MRRNAVITLLLALALVASSCTQGNSITVHALFDDVGDLVNRSSVQFADVKIGSVTEISLEGYQAKVTMSIDASVGLPANSMAVVRATSLLGEKLVEIIPPTTGGAGRLSDGDVIPSERTAKRAELQDVFLELGGILANGGINDLATFVDSAATIVRGKEAKLGEIFAELRLLTGTLAGRSTEIGRAVDGLDLAFSAFSEDSRVLSEAVDTSADALDILADRQSDLERLIGALEEFAAVSADYSSATVDDSDTALKSLRSTLDEVMKTTDDLDSSLTALARFVDLWPRVIPSDYVQLDTVVHDSNEGPSSVSGASYSSVTLEELLWGPLG